MLRAGHGLILVVIALLGFGVVMVTSASFTIDLEHNLQLADILRSRSFILALLAVGALIVGSLIPIRWLRAGQGWKSPMPWLLGLIILLLILVLIPGVGKQVNGARRWIELVPGLGFQPSELAKWGMILVLAWYVCHQMEFLSRRLIGFLIPMIPVLLVCALIGSQDLGTAVLVGWISVLLLIAAGAKIHHALILLPVGGLGFFAAVMASPYRLDRLRAFLNPYDDPQGIGYHVLQSMAAVSGGGLAGRGLGNSVQKFGYLPEDTTDFVFAVICEETGLIGACLVVMLYVILLGCGASIIRRLRHPFERLLAMGVVMTIGFQALLNLAVVTGLAPTKGIALPLLSSGGTGWLFTAFFVGLLVSMERQLARTEISGEIVESAVSEPQPALET